MVSSKHLLSLSLFLPFIIASPVPSIGNDASAETGISLLKDRQLIWSQATCSAEEITDASYKADLRWKAVGSQSAWSAVTNSWNSKAPGENKNSLPFPMMVSNFFHGPEHMNCQDVGDGTCNTMIQCDDTSFPAGYLILNSFDAFNNAISFAITTARDHLPTAADLQNDLTEAMGKFIGKWMEAEADYVNKIFSGAVGTLSDLYGLIQDGMQGAVPTGTDLATLKNEAQKIVYTKMIPAAWKAAPGGYSPFILVSDSPCSSQAEGDLAGHIDDTTAAQTHVCYDNKIFYVVNPTWTNNRGNLVDWKLNSLPGGTYDNLSGDEWGGVTLDDIVISSWDGYKLNGNKNGYQLPEDSDAIDGNGNVGNLLFEAGVRTPGFSTMPICDVNTLTQNLKNCNRNYEGFPCRKLQFGNSCN
ncbi:hypothetical protein BKA59DRAFT_446239 [Fusarium tricinctum]|uniref:Uncharacterized protein n=1 Tax=Fusarium tricinctum TaxID=61284 RepID=A0A8K0RK33_9HYPO|nr:hypothetical protein BKA59DRAFT_446239 [Fusarium tricinctum]